MDITKFLKSKLCKIIAFIASIISIVSFLIYPFTSNRNYETNYDIKNNTENNGDKNITIYGNNNYLQNKIDNHKINSSDYFFEKNIKIKYLNNELAPGIEFKIGENKYISDKDGNIYLNENDRTGNITILDGKYYISDKQPNLVIINIKPNDLSIIDPTNNNNIQSFETQYIKLELNRDKKNILIDKKLNSLINFDSYNNEKFYGLTIFEPTSKNDVFKINLNNNVRGKLEIKPYINFGPTEQINSSKKYILYAIKRLFPCDLKKLFQHPHNERNLIITDNYITYNITSNYSLATKIIDKKKFSARAYIEISFSLQGEKTFIAIDISGIRFKFVKNDKYFYIKPLNDNFFIDNIKNKPYILFDSITSDRFNIVCIYSYTNNDYLYFEIHCEINGATIPKRELKFKINKNFIDYNIPLEIACGIDKGGKKGKVSINYVDAY